MLWCQKIGNHDAVSTAIPVFKNENDLRVSYRLAAVRKTDFGAKAHGLAGQLLRDHLQTGLDKPRRIGGRAVWTLGKRKLSDFSLVVERYCERREIAGLVEGHPRRMDHGVQKLA